MEKWSKNGVKNVLKKDNLSELGTKSGWVEHDNRIRPESGSDTIMTSDPKGTDPGQGSEIIKSSTM